MNKKEKELFWELSKFLTADKDKLDSLLPEGATPAVLGHLFFNRMAATAFDILRSRGMLGKLNREFRNSLQNAYLQNVERNESFFHCLKLLSSILEEHKNKYAMLKGAMLCGFYPRGYRTSNDVDLLVAPEDISAIGKTLIKAGFRQGHIRNGEFTPADRREIIDSKMNRGETVPYILDVKLPFMRYLEVDINFSLDYKNSDPNTIRQMLQRAIDFRIADDVRIRTLGHTDFFIHLCAHLYKEATTLPWVKMNRDLTLYKFCDIYMELCILSNPDIDNVFKRAKEMGVADICACVILWTEQLIPANNTHGIEVAKAQLSDKEDLPELVFDPAGKKQYRYTESNIRKRFFAPDRTKLLAEV